MGYDNISYWILVWEKFTVENFHAKKVCGKIFSSLVIDENFFNNKHFLVALFTIYSVLCSVLRTHTMYFTQARTRI